MLPYDGHFITANMYSCNNPRLKCKTFKQNISVSQRISPSGEQPEAHFTNDFSIEIKIRWKIVYVAIYFLAITSLQRFAHATTAQLLCHVKKYCDDHSVRI